MSRVEPSLLQIETLYRERGADYFRLALAKTGDREQARDAVQEGFARAIRSRSSFRATGSLEAWIARCVLNAAHDAARTAGRSPTSADDAGEAGRGDAPDAERETGSAAELVRQAVARLPQRQRDALYLRHYLDLDYAAIAEALGVEVGTVSATLHAARAALANDLQEVAR
jgi:RNA polymerase sigma factor (sigma-70 family)